MSNDNPNQYEATSSLPQADGAGRLWSSRVQRYGVAFKLIGLVFILVSLILGIILVVFGYQLSRAARLQADKQITDATAALSKSFQIWLDGSQSALLNMAAQPDIRSMDPELQVPVIKSLAQTHEYMVLVSTVGLDGYTVARSDDADPVNYADRPWFEAAVSGEELAYQTLIVGITGKPALVIATPIRLDPSNSGNATIVGVAMFQADLGAISQIVEQIRLGSSGEAYVIDPMNRVIAHTRTEYSARLDNLSNYPPVAALRQGRTGLQSFNDAAQKEWRAASATLEGGWGVVVQQTAEESTAALRSSQLLVLMLAIAALAMMLVVVWLAVRRTLRPISELSETALAISEGNFFRQARVRTNDEFALLADVVNHMAGQIRDLVGGLEQRVSERTRSLERRSTQLEAAAQVARSAAGIRDLSQLFTETVQLISRQFGFYHAGIFIIDEVGEYAILQAANSPGGQRMLARGHQLRVGQVGIVGYVAASGRPRIALDVGDDAVYFDNPDLPQTRSEMALPLKVSGKVIGVLDVQSVIANAFVQEDVEVLQLLADQIALAIESARRLQETQQALAELDAVYGERTRQSWQERLHNQSLAYHYDRTIVDAAGYGQVTALSTAANDASAMTRPVTGTPEKQAVVDGEKDENAVPGDRLLEIPISLRTQGLGTIRLRRASNQAAWSQEEQELVRDAMAQIAPALENARLLEEIQQKAYYEGLIAKFSAKVQGSLDLETLLRTAVSEIGEVINAPRVRIRMTGPKAEPLTGHGGNGNNGTGTDNPAEETGPGEGGDQ